MSLDKSLRKLLGLPTKEDRLRVQLENLKVKTDMCIIIPSLTTIMTDEVIPRLRTDIHDVEAIRMLSGIKNNTVRISTTEETLQIQETIESHSKGSTLIHIVNTETEDDFYKIARTVV